MWSRPCIDECFLIGAPCGCEWKCSNVRCSSAGIYGASPAVYSIIFIFLSHIRHPKQLGFHFFFLISDLIHVPTSQFTKCVFLMTAQIIIVVFCGLAETRGLLWGHLPKPLKGLRWIHCQNESPLSLFFFLVSFCQSLRHILFSFFSRLFLSTLWLSSQPGTYFCQDRWEKVACTQKGSSQDGDQAV